MRRSAEKYCPYCGNRLERYFSVERAAETLDLSPEFFRSRIRNRQIGFIKIGKSVRIPESEILKLMNYYKPI